MPWAGSCERWAPTVIACSGGQVGLSCRCIGLCIGGNQRIFMISSQRPAGAGGCIGRPVLGRQVVVCMPCSIGPFGMDILCTQIHGGYGGWFPSRVKSKHLGWITSEQQWCATFLVDLATRGPAAAGGYRTYLGMPFFAVFLRVTPEGP